MYQNFAEKNKQIDFFSGRILQNVVLFYNLRCSRSKKEKKRKETPLLILSQIIVEK